MAEKDTSNTPHKSFLGTTGDDTIASGFQNQEGQTLNERLDEIDRVNGHEGDDAIRTGGGNDLAAGDMVGAEWSLVDGKWVYNADLVQGGGAARSFDDLIETGDGDDVLLGNGGDDTLDAGRGDDLINAGRGDDLAYGGAGDDLINLEQGADRGFGGLGDDTINAGDGNDVVHGDDGSGVNLLQTQDLAASSFAQHASSNGWTMTDDADGNATITNSVGTEVGEDYTISFELAANLSAGYSSGQVEVLWNGAVVDTIETQSGVYNTYEITVTSTGDEGSLSFRALQPEPDNSIYDFSGPVVSYDKTMNFGGEDFAVDAFAPGQASLYQVIDGQLKVFDVANRDYVDVGPNPGFKINAVGFNVEDDLIYGVAKSNGVDALGNAVSTSDIVMMDASGAAYRVGDGFYGDYVGDFDDSGNLWTFQSSLNRLSVVDVDNLDASGNPHIDHIDLPDGLFKDRTYDLAYNAQDDCFYAVVSPGRNGEAGKVVRIDTGDVLTGGMPTFQEVPITGTLYGDTMEGGMAKGAYGAVFLDGDGNLYYGLNRGDHDLDSSTASQGAIFKVNVDWEAGQAYSEFMSEAQSTGSNDGTVDPRSADAFAEVDAEAAVLLRNPEITVSEGGNDLLRGGAGDDSLFGNAGDDTLQGGEGQDALHGEDGNDQLFGGADADALSGGLGDDRLYGGTGDDRLSGGADADKLYGGAGADVLQGDAGRDTLVGNEGADRLSGGEGRDFMMGGQDGDQLDGGADADKLVGGSGADTLAGGSGDDHLWGGNWSGDRASDRFVFEAGSGKDIVHDFEADHDQIDLSSYGLDYTRLQEVMTDHGWAVEIDLSSLSGGQSGDRVFLKSVAQDDLDESNFLL